MEPSSNLGVVRHTSIPADALDTCTVPFSSLLSPASSNRTWDGYGVCGVGRRLGLGNISDDFPPSLFFQFRYFSFPSTGLSLGPGSVL
jgi:hypothetical protein